jgi:hypothetical protein
MKYTPAEFQKPAFHCPHSDCETYAKQQWGQGFAQRGNAYVHTPGLVVAFCEHCGKFSLWLNQHLLYPASRISPTPHPDMPDAIKADYEEARAVFSVSPRSSAALLRLAIQKLCQHLGQPGKNLNVDIGELVAKGLPVQIQRSLDIVRVVGNNQVHPGVLDIRDDPSIATPLFALVNIIVEDRIARPKQIDELYAKLPESARKQIEDRDGKAQP